MSMAVTLSHGSDPQDEFLRLAAVTRAGLRDVICLLVEKCLRLSAAKVGIVAFDCSAIDAADISWAISGHRSGGNAVRNILAATVASHIAQAEVDNRLKVRAESPKSFHVLARLAAGGGGDISEESALALIAGSDSSLWLPLRCGNKRLGWVGLGPGGTEGLRHPLAEEFERLVSAAILATHRLLLRSYGRQNGLGLNLVGKSKKLLEMEFKLSRAAGHNHAPILIRGERGSGKELAAHALHYFSKRKSMPFVPVLASAFAEALQLDELFGHEKNSFTGAAQYRKGKFLAAQEGTIFLDEVGDLPPATQVALLRTIETGEIQPLGRDLPIIVDVQIVAATNKDLAKLVAEGRFRDDLYDRLNVIDIEVPPLRERGDDIRLLTQHLLSKQCIEMNRIIHFDTQTACHLCEKSRGDSCITEGFYRALEEYDWPGNVRELANLIIRLSTVWAEDILDVRHLPLHILKGSRRVKQAHAPARSDLSLDNAVRAHILKVLSIAGNNQTQAAKMLGIARTTLQAKMKRLGIEDS
jgi:DNA-binding NtrC family response regulator